MSTIVKHDGASATKTISGTIGIYVVGPPRERMKYNGDVEGVYTLSSSGSYRWIEDEPRPSGSGPRTTYAAK